MASLHRTFSAAPVSAVTDEELDAILGHLDSKDGAITIAEVRQAFFNLDLPASYADSVFEKMDADNDGKVSRSELKVFVSAKIGRLRRAFDAVDANGDGRINSTEILKVLDAAHLKATVEDVEVLVRVMKGVKGGQGGAGGTGGAVGAVTFPQFLATFALLEPLDMVAMFDKEATLFELGSAGDLSQLLKGKTLTRRQTQALQQKVAAGEQNLPLRLFAAGVAATLAQTACQPIETIKVRLQNEANLANAAKRYNGFLRGGMAVARDEGILALWKGMLPSALREMSYSSIRFGLYAPIKKMMIGDKVSPAEVPLWKKIVAGGAAGGLGSAIANPTDLLKIRMQADSEVVAKRMSAHVADIYREGGVAGFWMGTSTTVARAVVLGATKLATYDEAKLRLKRLTGMEGLPLQTAAGAMAGFAYVCTSAPVDFTRTRLMTARQMAKQTGVAVDYKGPLDVFVKTIRTEGPLALYKGFFPQWARATPYSVIQFLAWEQMARVFKVSTVE